MTPPYLSFGSQDIQFLPLCRADTETEPAIEYNIVAHELTVGTEILDTIATTLIELLSLSGQWILDPLSGSGKHEVVPDVHNHTL